MGKTESPPRGRDSFEEPSEDTGRHIATTFYEDKHGRKVIKVTRSRYANNAVPNAVRHMQANEYFAVLCEVHDLRTGELHAVITHSVAAEIRILFKRPVREGM
jgi:hypothetical protein